MTKAKWLPTLLLVLTGIFLSLFVFYPGHMSGDSISQLEQGRLGVYKDWHPPMVSWVMGLFDRALPGPFGLLIFHAILAWSALGIIVFLSLGKARQSALVVALIGFWPSMFVMSGMFGKDFAMGSCLLFSIALFLVSARIGSKRFFWTACLALIYPLGSRHNAAIAVLPVCIWAGFIYARLYPAHPKKSKNKNGKLAFRREILAGVVILASLIVSQKAFNKFYLNPEPGLNEQMIFMHDIIGISIGSGKVLLPDFLPKYANTSEDLVRFYATQAHPIYGWGFPWTRPYYPMLYDANHVAILRGSWVTAVISEPIIYLKHRWETFKSLIGLGMDHVCIPYEYRLTKVLDLEYPPSPFREWFISHVDLIKDGIFFRGWIYLVALTAMICVSFRRRRDGIPLHALALGVSGVLYVCTAFIVTPGCDFRLQWWIVPVTLLYPVLAFGPRNQRDIMIKKSR